MQQILDHCVEVNSRGTWYWAGGVWGGGLDGTSYSVCRTPVEWSTSVARTDLRATAGGGARVTCAGGSAGRAGRGRTWFFLDDTKVKLS